MRQRRTFVRRLCFEPLEERRTLSITVDTLVDENDGIGAGTGTSLREAIAAATPGETIDFSVTGTINLTSLGHLTVDKSLTISGPGANLLTVRAFDPTPATKNGDGNRVFYISDGASNLLDVSISGVTISGGDLSFVGEGYAGNGAGVFSLEKLTITASEISGNATNSGGGGIWARNGSLTLQNTTIRGNTGTGISASHLDLTIEDSLITENAGAGAVITTLSTNQPPNVSGTTISNNLGRGLDIEAREMLITDSTISGNQTTSRGGGISARYTFVGLTIENTSIIGNSAGTDGGGIWSGEGNLTITGSTISGNTATGSAGGIRKRYGNLSISQSTITDNQAGNDGGGIWARQVSAANITSSTISGNSTLNDNASGGGIYARTSTLTVTASTISGNSTDGDHSFAGGVYSTGGNVTLASTIVANNMTKGPQSRGGAVYAITGNLSVTNSTISGNRTEGDFSSGGGMYHSLGNFTVAGSTISGNSTLGFQSSGGGLYAMRSELSMTDSTIEGNHVDGYASYGGGMYVLHRNTLITGSTISGNSAERGGGIASSSQDGLDTYTTTIANSTVSGNVATDVGGGVFNRTGTTVIRYSTVTDNTAPNGYGSGVASRGLANAFTEVGGSIIAGNSGTDVDWSFDGGANSFQSNGYNIVGTGDALAAFNQPGDQTGIANPLLGPLAANGGPTLTHAVLSGSPAIDAGNIGAIAGSGDVPSYDQRGQPFTRVYGGQIDVGAFEVQPMPAAFFGDYSPDNVVDGADYVLWRKTLGATVMPYSGADGDGDGAIDQDDHDVWRAHFGQAIGVGSGASIEGGVGSGEGALAEPVAPDESVQGEGVVGTAGQASSGTRAEVSSVERRESSAGDVQLVVAIEEAKSSVNGLDSSVEPMRIADFGLWIYRGQESRNRNPEPEFERDTAREWRDAAIVAWLDSRAGLMVRDDGAGDKVGDEQDCPSYEESGEVKMVSVDLVVELFGGVI